MTNFNENCNNGNLRWSPFKQYICLTIFISWFLYIIYYDFDKKFNQSSPPVDESENWACILTLKKGNLSTVSLIQMSSAMKCKNKEY